MAEYHVYTFEGTTGGLINAHTPRFGDGSPKWSEGDIQFLFLLFNVSDPIPDYSVTAHFGEWHQHELVVQDDSMAMHLWWKEMGSDTDEGGGVAANTDNFPSQVIFDGTAPWVEAWMLFYGDVNTVQPIYNWGAAAHTGGTTTEHATPEILVGGEGRTLLGAFFNQNGYPTNFSTPDTMYEVVDIWRDIGHIGFYASDMNTPVSPGNYSLATTGPNTDLIVSAILALNSSDQTDVYSPGGSAGGGPPEPLLTLPWEFTQLDDLTPERLNQNFEAIRAAYNRHTH